MLISSGLILNTEYDSYVWRIIDDEKTTRRDFKLSKYSVLRCMIKLARAIVAFNTDPYTDEKEYFTEKFVIDSVLQ